MTPAQQKKQMRRIVTGWAQALCLHAWTIQVAWDEEPEDEDAWASVEISDLYDQATIRFRKDWHDHDLYQKNRIVVHELLHILFRDYSAAARSIGIVGLSADARAVWSDRCHDEEEGLVDRLANRFLEVAGVIE